jgi:rubrerythrin
MAEDLVVLREILQRELETINAYEKMLERVSDPELRTIIDHVTDEEREHVAEMYYLIMARDPKQQARSQHGEDQLREMRLLAPLPGATGSEAGKEAVAASTAAEAAGLAGPLLSAAQLSAAQSDPTPPPAPIFPEGAWSVGGLKRRPA